jgi:uncharacterized YigZ family protein
VEKNLSPLPQGVKDNFFCTIAAPAEGIYREKGSRFLAFAFPVQRTEEVNQHLAHLQSLHHTARHCCYAYRMGKDGASFRANDDGEPSSTAGRPILGQLLSAGLTDVLIVVVRYFGGVLLGTSGLTTAYRQAAAAAIAAAQVVQRQWESPLAFSFPYHRMGEVMQLVKHERLRVLAQDFTCDPCRLTLSVPDDRMAEVRQRLAAEGC